MTSQAGRAAEWYARNKGWRVLPVSGKKPCIPDWPAAATTDPETIRAWYQQFPNAGVGLATGQASGVFALDVDPDHQGMDSLFDLIQNYGALPETVINQTGGGGLHYLFSYPNHGTTIPSLAGLYPGIDIRGEGGQVVLPPSIHPNGKAYEWEISSRPDEVQLAEAPAWLLEAIAGHGKPQNKGAAPQLPAEITEGRRHDTLVSLAGTLRRKGLTPEEIEIALQAINQNRCDPPLPDAEIMQVAASMARYEAGNLTPAPWQQAESAPAPENRFKIITAGDCFQPQPPPEWIIQDLFSAGSLSIVCGAPGSKKTYSMLDAAVCVATGKDWAGHKTKQCSTLFIDEESGERRLKRRISEVLRGEMADQNAPISAVCLAGFNFRDPQEAQYLQTLIENTGAKLVIIDSLAAVSGGADENSVKDVQPIMTNLRRVAEKTSCALVLIHHTGKAAGSGYRGSSAIAGAADLVLNIASAPQGEEIRFKSEKARDVEPINFTARACFGEGEFYLTTYGEVKDIKQPYSEAERAVIDHLKTYGESEKSAITGNKAISARNLDDAIYSLKVKKVVQRTNPNDCGRGATARYALVGGGNGLS